jgi:hypothetical protein
MTRYDHFLPVSPAANILQPLLSFISCVSR